MDKENLRKQLNVVLNYDPSLTQMFEELEALHHESKRQDWLELCLSLFIKDIIRCIHYHKYKFPFYSGGEGRPKPMRIKELSSMKLMMIAGSLYHDCITRKTASHLIEKAFVEKYDFMKYVTENGLWIEQQVEFTPVVKKIIEENSSIVNDYKSGNEKAINSLIGKVMKKSKGADAKKVKEKLLEELK